MTNLFEKEANDAFDEQRILIQTKRTHYYMWKAIDIFFKIVSFGKLNRFMTHFTTTIGRTVYYPIDWERDKAGPYDYVILKHERKHVRQVEKICPSNFTVGLIIYGFLYFLIFLPIGLAWFRYKFEREAYLESYQACKEVGIKPDVNHYIKVLTGPSYLWTWPFKKSVKRWFYKHCV